MYNQIVQRGEDAIQMDSSRLRVVIEPQLGGKIRSFFAKRTETEFLYADPRAAFPAGDDYLAHDLSGFDECFPTVWPCPYPDGSRRGTPMGDHGYLWQGPWRVDVANDRVEMSKDVPVFQCMFQRTCQLESPDCLRLDYAITNYGQEPMKYVYSAHPMLATSDDVELVLPDNIDKMYVFFVRGLDGVPEKTCVDWPLPTKANLGPPFSPDRHSVIKLYTPKLEEGRARAAICHASLGQALQFEFDPIQLPHLGVLYVQGYDPANGPFQDEVFFGLEPTTGVGDDLPTCHRTGTVAELAPGESKEFWIRLRLLDVGS